MDGINVHYDGALVLEDVSIKVGEEEFCTVVGANGAGKSTLLCTISGLVKSSEGMITFRGERIDDKPPYEVARLGIAHCPERRRLGPEMTCLENLKMGAYRREDNIAVEEDLEWIYNIFPVLEEREEQEAGTLSGGEQQMLALGRAIISQPELLMLDEPFMGLAPGLKKEFIKGLERIREKKDLPVLLAEQDALSALKLAESGYIIETGRIVRGGSSEELLQDEKVKSAYL